MSVFNKGTAKCRSFVSAGSLAALLGCALQPVSASCVLRDLGPLSMCVPSDWQLSQGRIDSVAGTFKADGLSVSYDIGLYSDPLKIPPEATEASEAAVTIDGHAGRKVAFTLQAAHFVGVHLPGIRSTSMGSIKLTVLAQATNAARLQEAAAALLTVRIKS